MKYKGSSNVSDIFLSTAMIPKRRPIRWINRKGFVARKTVIVQWLFFGHVLTLGYKSTLLSILITIRYEGAIDNLQDMAESGAGFNGCVNGFTRVNSARPVADH